MLVGEQDPRERVSRYRACAARLRAVAALATGDPIGPDYVEELASDFERYADALEPVRTPRLTSPRIA